MSKINIFSLIYKSPKYVDFIYNKINENTPTLATDAKFYFIVNFKKECSEKIIGYLKEKNYPYFIFDKYPNQLDYPSNISQIYACWNACTDFSDKDCEIIVLVNSDMAFSKDWLENLLKRLDKQKVVSSLLVESGKIPSLLPHTVVKNFGRTPETFQKEKFEQFAEMLKEDTQQPFGVFMPMAIYKENFIKAGGYPEGNMITKDGRFISGDYIFFYDRLSKINVSHLTSFDSCVYHFQEGEVDSND